MTKSQTILVVDDSPTQLAVLEDALNSCGFVVVTAQNGEKAIEQVFKSRPHLVLSDVLMPELNGYHLCRLLKNDPATSDIPVILLTNLSEQHDRFWGENAGADLYLEKGSDLSQICSEVQTVLRKALTHPRPANDAPATGSGDLQVDVRARVAGILDRLLYDSTISNEILKLTGQVHDLEALARDFFKFLTAICRYAAAGLLINFGNGRMAVCLHLPKGGSQSDIMALRQTICNELDAQVPADTHLETVIIKQANSGETDALAPEDYHLSQALPIMEENELLAGIALFAGRNGPLTKGTLHSLNVVADRFLIIARYLKKTREIESYKADFLSMLVHDLRSPLTSIKGFTDLLVSGILGSVSMEQSGALSNIQGGCERLLALVEDILDLSKLEAGKMKIHPGPTPLPHLIEEAGKDLNALLREKCLSLKVEISKDIPLLSVDGRQIGRVFNNLLSNAIKFTEPGGEIKVKASLQTGNSEAGQSVRVDITDTGLGIPEEKQRFIFTRYQQLSSGERERVGTGLGLAICKEIIQLHGGHIWVESPVQNSAGSRFSFVLPMR